jgi:hypothetical protein
MTPVIQEGLASGNQTDQETTVSLLLASMRDGLGVVDEVTIHEGVSLSNVW